MKRIAMLMMLLFPSVASAQIDLRLNAKTQTDQKKPAIVLTATEDIKNCTVTFERSDGKKKTVNTGKLRRSKSKRIPFVQSKGVFTYEVKIKGTTSAGEQFLSEFETEAAYVDPIKLSIKKDGVDVANGELVLHANQVLSKVDIEVFDTDGKKLHESTQPGGNSSQLTITWPATNKEVGSIRLKAHDLAGFWAGVLVEPFWVEIPHREVIFDFGKSTWQPSETPKLEETLAGVRNAMKKHASKGLSMSLYIAGYTDTVGNAGANQTLSTQRARAIAKWFESQGLGLKVYYQGFGESVLAVKTADNTPEERNRRALYILGNSPPPRSPQIPKSNWKLLR